MKVLLTGSNGFIGKNLLESLSSKFNFVAPAHKELDLLNASAVKKYLFQNNFEVVIHSASVGGNRALAKMQGVLEANQKMFLNLAENRDKFGRMIFFGSGAEYGKHRPIVKIKESEFGQEKPQDEYGRAKYFASEFISSAQNIINLRLFGVFGKYEDYKTRFISNAICHAVFGMPMVINQNVKFDYLYINDLVNIVSYFMDHEPKEKFYNVGTGQPVELVELAKIVEEVSGQNLEIVVRNIGLNREYTCDNGRLLKELGNFEFTPFKRSISELYKWYEENKKTIDKDSLDFN